MNILCPVCRNILNKDEKTCRCVNSHSFDIASQGYINLYLHKSQTSGDNQSMINARRDFLSKDHYRFLLDEINRIIDTNDSLVDLACGEGYYTSQFKAKDKIGIDLSKSGLKIASKKDKTTTYILSSIFNTPLEDKCADKVLTIFAPIAKQEILRIMKDDGSFILVKPDTDHLFELKQAIYEKPYLNEVEDICIDGLELSKEIPIRSSAILDSKELNDLFMMTPYYNTTSRSDKDKIKDIAQLKVTFTFLIDIYRKSI